MVSLDVVRLRLSLPANLVRTRGNSPVDKTSFHRGVIQVEPVIGLAVDAELCEDPETWDRLYVAEAQSPQ